MDVPLLVEHFLADYPAGIDPAALDLLGRHPWPGNIRELENQLTSARAMAGGERLRVLHLWGRLQESEEPAELDLDKGLTLRKAREGFERRWILDKLEERNWQLEVVATDLGLSRSRLYDLIRKYRLKQR